MALNTMEWFRHIWLHLYSCIKDITLEMARLLAETCWWRY